MAKGNEKLKYYKTDKLPLLMQGFELQSTSLFLGILEDKKDFTLKVDRGVVNYLDVIGVNDLYIDGNLEGDWNGSLITLLAGGQQLLVDEPMERYNFSVDLGDRAEQKIPVIINGGQTINSRLFLPDITSNSGSNFLQAQVLAYYTTEKHQEFLKEEAKFYSGLGLKRQSFRVRLPAGSTAPVTLEQTIPVNQGGIVGFSVLTYSGDSMPNVLVDVAFDDLKVNLNVWAARFSKLSQRDPFIQWIKLNPGSTLQFSIYPRPGGFVISNDCFAFLTIYFDN